MVPAFSMQYLCHLDRDSAGHGDAIVRSFICGHGGVLTTDPKPKPDFINVYWGILRGNTEAIHECQASNIPFLYIDHAYLARGHSKQNYRITLGALQTTAPVVFGLDITRMIRLLGSCDGCEPFIMGSRRWALARPTKSTVLVCPPTAHMANFYRIGSQKDWTEAVVARLPSGTNVKIRRKGDEEPLASALHFAAAVVTFNSNIATDAILAGVPVFVSDVSAARRVGLGLEHLSYIHAPMYDVPRLDWLKTLSLNQFSLSEISQGQTPFNRIQNGLQTDR